jgi:hypothetical protein
MLKNVKLRRTPLSVAFHVKDLIGMGVVERTPTPSGTMYRLLDHRV